MSVLYPASLDSFPDPTRYDQLDHNTAKHDELHTDHNSALEALEAKVGADNSAVATSHDYRLNRLEDSHQRQFSIDLPTNAENATLFFTPIAMTVTQIRAVVRGSSSPSLTWTLRHGTDRSAAGTEVNTGGKTTTNTTTGENITSFDAPAIAANSWVWLVSSASAGVLLEFSITIVF